MSADRLDILFVNPHDQVANWTYLPMGVFGICDYLTKHNASAAILNLGSYMQDYQGRPLDGRMGVEYYVHAGVRGEDLGSYIDYGRVREVLERTIQRSRPRWIGMPLHWLQLIAESLEIMSFLKGRYPELRIVVGGLTASFLGRRLLEEIPEIDAVVTGDAFEPMRQLLDGVPAPANVLFRDGDRIVEPASRYVATAADLSDISFARLDLLLDYRRYLEVINRRLAFPVLLKRGCSRNCRFCGGSAAFFQAHFGSGTEHCRSFDAVIADLERLLEHGCERVYFYAGTAYLTQLLEQMQRQGLAQRFHINMVVDLDFDEDLFAAYERVSRFDTRTCIEISPENVVGEEYVKSATERVRIETFWKRVDAVRDILGDHEYELTVFFSRYHPEQKSLRELIEVLNHICWLRQERVRDPRVHIPYLPLSTDPGSDYWMRSEVRNWSIRRIARDYRYLEVAKRGLNWNMYAPEELSEADLAAFEKLVYYILPKPEPREQQ